LSLGQPKPTLSVADAIAIIVGIVVGAGIFETPAFVAANAGSPAILLLAWVAGGLMTLVGALCFAELATAYPHPGGNYHYLVRAFGTAPAFLFVWARLAIIQTGSIAMLGFVFGDYASQLWDLGAYSASFYAAAAVIALTAMNISGLIPGKRTQNLLTIATVAGLAVVVVVGIFFASPASGTAASGGGSPTPFHMSLGMVMIFVLLTYGGWSEAAFISAEVRRPRRNMAVALIGSTAIITAIYLLVNYALLRGLGMERMAGAQAVAAELMQRTLGQAGVVFIALCVAVAALGSINATIITGARTNYAMGRDYRIFRWMGEWSPRGNTPVNALIAQSAIALGLIAVGTAARSGFKTMVEFTTPVFWAFLLLTGVSLMVLRHREPHAERPFRVPLYPVTPLLFCCIAAYMLYSSLAYTGMGALLGVLVLAAGAPLLVFVSRRRVELKHLEPDTPEALATESEAA
jgi:basic amino acid/polyamine antiporter, APA family